MRHELRLFLIALQFLTRVPIPAAVGFRPEWLHDSARHFPAVGLVVGGAGALALGLAASVLPMTVAVLLSMAVTVVMTGAFHEDGVADTCDGLGGAVSRERALAIMKDSRIGTYGALGLGLTLALKATLLAALASHDLRSAMAALVLAHVTSRSASVSLIRWLPYAGDPEHAKAKPLAQRIGWGGWTVALGWSGAVGIVIAAADHDLALAIVAAWFGAALAAIGCARWFRRRLGGVTGDTLGATQQWAELGVYLAFQAVLGPGGWALFAALPRALA
jgi:adenosylcobinamide-GDP ribazoletransferase